MVCLGFEPGAAGLKARTNPLSYSGTRPLSLFARLPISSIKPEVPSVWQEVQKFVFDHSFMNFVVTKLSREEDAFGIKLEFDLGQMM